MTRSGEIKLRAFRWLLLSIFVVLLDQATKGLAKHFLVYQRPYELTSFLSFTLNYNFGAAFSFLGDAGGWQRYLFIAIAIVISVILFAWLCKLGRHEKLKALGLSLILGGAIGNVIDRIRLGYVTDFIDFHWQGWHYPTFNVADSFVCVGAFFLILGLIWHQHASS